MRCRRCCRGRLRVYHHGDEHRQVPGDKESYGVPPRVQSQEHRIRHHRALAGGSEHLRAHPRGGE